MYFITTVLLQLYTADVLATARRHGIGAHSHADDTQLYHHAPADLCVASASAVVSCRGELDKWMCSNRMKLNADKKRRILSFSGRVSTSRRQTFTLSNSVASTSNYQLPSHAWESSSTDVLSPHEAFDWTVLLPASSAAHCPSRPIS